MNIVFKKKEDHFIFFKNGTLIQGSKKKPLTALNIEHAKSIIKELKKEISKDPYSILNLSLFSSNLDSNARNEIIVNILDNLDNDIILYRFFDDENLIKLMNKNYSNLITDFNKTFKIKLWLVKKLFEIKKIDKCKKLKFEEYLLSLNNFYITAFFKLIGITKSVILSYYFLNNKIKYKKLFNLMNLESKLQQNQWGYVDEQKKIDEDCLCSLKKISIFLKNIS